VSERRPPDRGLVALDGAIALLAILLVVQMWLLTAALEAFLAGHVETSLPAAGISGLLFAGSFGLYRFMAGVDRLARRPPRPPTER